MKFSSFLPALVAVLFVSFLPSLAHAMNPSSATNVVNTPFDGGISLLVAAGVGYAAKKGHSRRLRNKSN